MLKQQTVANNAHKSRWSFKYWAKKPHPPHLVQQEKMSQNDKYPLPTHCSYCLELKGQGLANRSTIKVLTELEMTSDAQQNGGKARYVKHCKDALPVIIKRFNLRIGLNDIVRYGVT